MAKKKMNKALKSFIWLLVTGFVLALILALEKVFGWEYVKIVKVGIVTFCILTIKSAASLVLSLLSPIGHRVKTLVTLMSSLINYLAWIIILCWDLTILGVNVGTIVTSVGILALVVGFGAESLIADAITGMFMIFENQYNVGDIIEVDGYRGEVTNIGIRTTAITDAGKNVKIINNSEMKNILNRSEKGSVAISDIYVSYSTDIELLEKKIPNMLVEIHKLHNNVMPCLPIYLGVQSFTKESIVLRFIADVEENQIYNVTRILNRELLGMFKKENVKMPE